ncbi:symbiosis regulated acidic polypeptide SRAP32-3 [Pisolithus albus]|nr:symbiosis regulated acidic polypeptide SRAP32-3 [Pisolithus albus]
MSDNVAQALAFINSATLKPVEVGLHSRAAVLSEQKDRGKYLGEPGKDGAATIGAILVSVLANLSEDNRTDIANCLEYASRHAAQEVGEDIHTPEYWTKFERSFHLLGWFRQKHQRSEDFIHGQTTGAQNLGDYLIDNVKSNPRYSSTEREVIIRAFQSLRSQPDKRAFFKRFTAGGNKGSIGVSVATVTNGTLRMLFSGFTFSCSAVVDDYLISSIQNIDVAVKKDEVIFEADQNAMDASRGQLGASLDEMTGDYIDSVDI